MRTYGGVLGRMINCRDSSLWSSPRICSAFLPDVFTLCNRCQVPGYEKEVLGLLNAEFCRNPRPEGMSKCYARTLPRLRRRPAARPDRMGERRELSDVAAARAGEWASWSVQCFSASGRSSTFSVFGRHSYMT